MGKTTHPLQARFRAAGALLALAGAGVPQAAAAQESVPPPGAAFVEWSVSRSDPFVGEALRLTLRFGFEAEFHAERLVQLFPQSLDVPAQVEAPLPAALLLRDPRPAEPDARGGASFVLDGSVVRGRRQTDHTRPGGPFVVVELERTVYAPEEPAGGSLSLPAPHLAFAHGSLREDPFAGPSVVDRLEARITGAPLVLDVRPLPSVQQPASFTGAVGTLRCEAMAEPRNLVRGDHLALVLTFTGPGSGGTFRAPELAPLAGFDLLGRIELPATGGRTFRYDLRPRATDVVAVPSVAVAYLDPADGSYHEVLTEPIPIRVRERRAERPPPTGDSEASDPGPGSVEDGDGRGASSFLLRSLATATILFVLLALRRRARRRRRVWDA